MAPSRTLSFERKVWTVTSHASASDRGGDGGVTVQPAWLEFEASTGEKRVSPGVGPFTQSDLDGFTSNKLLEWLLLADPQPADAAPR
jgi:hypothetical protein